MKQNLGRVQHVILTRFNCHLGGTPKDYMIELRSSPAWLEKRFELFEAYCCPTLLGQTSQDFIWLVYFDAATPRSFLDRAERDLHARSNMVVKTCETFTDAVVRADVAQAVAGQCDWLLSTRLDNDDGLNRNFVRWLRDEARVGVEEGLNFPLGLVAGRDRLYLSRQASNAFISMSEPFDGFRTIFRGAHNELASVVDLRDIKVHEPAWLQVVHGGNLSNKLRGHRIARRQVPPGFEPVRALADPPRSSETSLAIALENWTVGFARQWRDRGARVYRSLRRRLRQWRSPSA